MTMASTNLPETTLLTSLIREAGRLLASSMEGVSHLLCDEIQGMVDLLIAAQMPEVAVDLITSHAYGDDDWDDLHHQIYLAAEGQRAGDPEAMAWEMVHAQLRGEPLRTFRIRIPDRDLIIDITTVESRDAEAKRWRDDYRQTVYAERWQPGEGWTVDQTYDAADAPTRAGDEITVEAGETA